MKRLITVLILALVVAGGVCFAQQKYALVIGNNNYTTVERLTNPVNDATDIAAKLRTLGYQVDLQTNITKAVMDRVVQNYMQRLAQDRSNEGFFWFAGHGVQIDGENYLLPVDVDATDDLSVKHSSYSVSYLTASFDQRAKNKVNIVVLDACRNNPFRNMGGGSRSLGRGLSVISDHDLPSDLLIIYSTAAGEVAADGAAGERNSPFARAFMQSMDSSEDIAIVVRDITNATMRLTSNRQRPFTGGSIVTLRYYSLNPRGQPNTPGTTPTPTPAPAPTPAPRPAAPPVVPVPTNFIRVEGGTFEMGSTNGEDREKPVHSVTVRSFSIGKFPVTQKEWFEVMGTTVRQQRDMANKEWPMRGEGDSYPMYYVNWLEAIEYCNRRSLKEGLTPAYRGSGNNITCDWNANGYRLPTEAEWEYAAKGGNQNFLTYEYAGSNSVDTVAWYSGNSGNSTKPVGTKAPNALGIYDMSGNVWEWCWDWYGSYSSGTQNNPTGASSGSRRVARGGSWYASAQGVRSADRNGSTPADRNGSLGFRVVRP